MTAIPQSISIDYSMEPPYFFFWQFQFNFLVNGVLRYTWLSVCLIFWDYCLTWKNGTTIKWIFVINGILGVVAPI